MGNLWETGIKGNSREDDSIDINIEDSNNNDEVESKEDSEVKDDNSNKSDKEES